MPDPFEVWDQLIPKESVPGEGVSPVGVAPEAMHGVLTPSRPAGANPFAGADEILDAGREPTFGEKALGVGEKILGGVGAVVGAPKRATDWLMRESARRAFGMTVPDDFTTGQALRQAAGLSIDPAQGHPENVSDYGRRLAGGAVEFVGNLVDPLVWSLPGVSKAVESGALAERTLARAGLDVAEEMRTPLEALAKHGAALEVPHKALQATFATLMGTGAVEEAANLYRSLQRDGRLTPEIAEQALSLGLSSYMAKQVGEGVFKEATDPFANFNRVLERPEAERVAQPLEAEQGAQSVPERPGAAAEPIEDLVLGMQQDASQVGAPRLGPKLPPLSGEGADLVRLSPASAEAGQVSVPPSQELGDAARLTPDRLKLMTDAELKSRQAFYEGRQDASATEAVRQEQVSRAQAKPAADITAGAPDFQAWAEREGVPVDDATRPAAVSRWLSEHPDATVDQRAEARPRPPEPAPGSAQVAPEPVAPPPDSPAPPITRVASEPPAEGRQPTEPGQAPPQEPEFKLQPVDVAAVQAEQPTEAQAEAGNYQKGHTRIAGLDISIENPSGSQRRPEWPALASHYGYIRGTVGKDKDHIDVFVKPGTPADYDGPVHVVNQTDRAGRFDEHKAMLGWPTKEEALPGYAENYSPGAARARSVSTFANPDAFRIWLKSGNTKRAIETGPRPKLTEVEKIAPKLAGMTDKELKERRRFYSERKRAEPLQAVEAEISRRKPTPRAAQPPVDEAGVRVLPGEERLPSQDRAFVDQRARQVLEDLIAREKTVKEQVFHGQDAELARVGLEDLIAEKRDVNDTRVEETLSDLYGKNPTRRAARIKELSRRGSALADIPASAKEMAAALERDKGNPLEMMIRDAVRKDDPAYAQAQERGALDPGEEGAVPFEATDLRKGERRQVAAPMSEERRIAMRRTELARELTLPEEHPAVERLVKAETAQRIDSLTGLRTLAAFREKFPEAAHGSRELPAGHSLTFFDLAGFKKVNDTFGHDAADQVLRRMADVLIAEAGHDNAFRRSGDEFFALHKTSETKGLLDRVAKRLASETVVVDNAGERKVITDGIRFHSGTGETLAEADTAANASRAAKGRGVQDRAERRADAPAQPGMEDRPGGPQAELAGSVRFASKLPGFYSQLERVVTDPKAPRAASGSDWLAYLRDPKRAVKADELKWTGLDDYLKGKAGQKVTRDEVAGFLHENRVDVEEVSTGTKYADYQTPGGTNYREVRLTLPAKEYRASAQDEARINELESIRAKNKRLSPTEMAEYQALEDKLGAASAAIRGQNFEGGHHDEPNVLAHARLNDRTDADGKRVLFVEEIQSDWAQKGRREGFSTPPRSEQEILGLLDEAGYVATNNGTNWIVTSKDGRPVRNRLAGGEEKSQFAHDLGQVAGMVLGRQDLYAFQHRVPPAPFVTSTEGWTNLALKRTLRMAAEEGYDRVAWTTGEQQAERYALSKQVHEVKAFDRGDGKYDLMVRDQNDRSHDLTGLSQSALADNVGKELADKIAQQSPLKWESYSSLDLKVGGEGMKGFYDKIVPQAMDKLGRKWGARVGETKIDTGNDLTASTPYSGPTLTRQEVLERRRRADLPATLQGQAKEVADLMANGVSFADAMARQSSALARTFGGELAKLPRTSATAHSIDVTPEMRRSVMEQGFPLFAAARPGVGGTVTIDALRSAFKGVEWREDAGGYRARIRGRGVLVNPDASITVSDAEQAAFGASARAAGLDEAAAKPVAKTYTLAGRHMIEFARGAGQADVDEEAFHVAMSILPDELRLPVLKKYGFDQRREYLGQDRELLEIEAEERAAKAYREGGSDAPTGLFARIASWFRYLYRWFFPNADAVFERIRRGEAFSDDADVTARQGQPIGAFAARPSPGQRGLPGIAADVPARVEQSALRTEEAPLPESEAGQLYHRGNLAEYTGEKTADGFYRIRYLEGHRKGETVLTQHSPEAQAEQMRLKREYQRTERGGQADMFGTRDMLQPTEARVTEGREGEGPLFTQEAEARARAARGRQGSMFAAAPAPKPVAARDTAIKRAAEAGKDEGAEPLSGKPGEFPINLERIGVDEDVKQMEARIVNALSSRMGKAKGYRSWEEARDLALKSGLTQADFIRLQKHGALTDHQITAGRLMREEAAKDAKAKWQATKEASPDDALEAERAYLASVTRLGAIAQGTVGAGAEAGRALAAHRMLSEGLRPGEQFFHKILRAHPGMRPEVRDRLLRAVTENNQREIIDAAREAIKPKRMDQFLEFWKAGLVSGPPTLFGNILSNTSFEGMRTAERGVAGLIDGLVSKVRGTEQERFASEGVAAATGLLSSVPNALKLVWNGHLEEQLKLGSKYEGQPGAIPGQMGRVVRLPFRSLQAWDDGARHMAAQAELVSTATRMALREARAGKIQPGEADARVAGIIEAVGRYNEARLSRQAGVELSEAGLKALGDRQSGLLWAQMDKAAHEATFQDAVGKFTQVALDLRSAGRPLGIPLGDLVAPFIKTPSRILYQAGRRTPLGFLEAIKAWKSMKEGTGTQGEFSEALARPLVGTLLGVSLYAAARAGLITGSGPSDDRKRKLLQATGWQPYSVKVGDNWIQAKRLEPLATILGLAADLAEASDEKDAGTVAEKLQAALVQNISEKSWLTGITSLSEAWQDPKRYGAKWLRQLEGSLVPNILRKTAVALDPTVRDSSSLLGPVAAGIPWVSSALPARMQGTGEPLERPGTAAERLLSPFPRSEKKEGRDLETELLDLDYAPSEVSKTLQIPGSKTRVELNDREMALLSDADARTTAMLRDVVRKPGWRLMDGEARKEFVEKAYAAGRRRARQVLYFAPSFQRRASAAMALKQAGIA